MTTLTLAACEGDEQAVSPLHDLDLVGVDFELNSIVLENTGDSQVRTQGLWIHRDGKQFELDIFIIDPRATISFSMRELGDISVSAGELALFEQGSLDDPDSMLEYVAWGGGDLELADIATDAGLWPPEEGGVPVPESSAILVRIDPTGTGPAAWEPSDTVD